MRRHYLTARAKRAAKIHNHVLYKMSTKYELRFLPRLVKQVVVNAAGLFPAGRSLFIVGMSYDGDVIYLTHVG